MKPHSLPPIEVSCPKCGARPGEPCMMTVNVPHREREDAAIEEPVAHANPKQPVNWQEP